ncbi:hybrid sensor histidine kinase/response regulator transcription factor [Pseudoalteromonas rubra]|nr:ATP-binding protein [Pseudoalteromonas rubra]
MLQLSFCALATTYTTLTVADGLPSNRIFDIERDHTGFAWFATDKGLARYDGAAIDVFSRDHTPTLSNALWIRDILIDAQQQLWVAGKQGLEVRGPNSEYFRPLSIAGRTQPLNIYTLFLAQDNRLWAGAADGLYMVSQDALLPVKTHINNVVQRFKILSITQASEHALMLATTRGLYLFDTNSGKATPVTLPPGESVMADKLWTVEGGQTWVAMHGLGLGMYNQSQNKVELLYRDPNEFDTVGYVFDLYKEHGEIHAASLNTGMLKLTSGVMTHIQSYPPLLSLYKDNNLRIYGTFNEGVIIESVNHSAMSNFAFSHPSETGKYEINQLTQFNDYLWLADQLAGLCQYTLNGKFKRCVSSESHSAQAVTPTSDGRLWAAMYHELLVVNPENAQVDARYSLADYMIPEAINTLVQSDDGSLWLAHSFDGLSRFAPDTRAITHFTSTNSPLLSNQLHHLAKEQDRLWLATDLGLQVYSLSSEQFKTIPGSASQPFTATYSVTPAPDGRIWVQTDRGLRLYNSEQQRWQDLPEPLNKLSATSLAFDDKHTVWLSTGQGLWHWQPNSGAVAFYNHGDGLFRKGYLEGTATHSDGHIWFASTEGITRLNPDKLNRIDTRPQISVLTITAPHGEQQHYYNTSTVPAIDPQHASLRLRLANGDLINNIKQKFRYQLSGVADTWVELGNEHTLMIPRLPWGDYTLRLKATDNQGNWSEQISELNFTVHTPWYASALAKTSYALLATLLIYGAYRIRISALKRRQQQLQDTIRAHTQTMQMQNSQLEAAQAQRTALLKTLSHELMTPVTLIQGPAEQLRNSTDEQQRTQMANLVISNTKRLKVLIEHLMFISSNNSQAAPVTQDNWQPEDISALLQEQLSAFTPLLTDKSLNCNNQIEPGLLVSAPPDQLQQLISNLLSNAIKYSYEGGEIHLSLKAARSSQHAVLSVSDQGIGIAPEHHTRIFEPEYRTKAGHQFTSGQGLGLSRVKEIVDQLSGQIQLESAPGQGTCFTVNLPLFKAPTQTHVSVEAASRQVPPDKTQCILLIDDTPDMLEFLHTVLAPDYQVLTASDGEAGLALARAKLPDMVISDVMMPVMDGFALTQALKSDPLTAHIPLMLVTANLNEEKHLKGLALQADDYLTKPFNLDAFKLKIRNTFKLIEATQAQLKAQLMPATKRLKQAPETPKQQFANNPATLAFLDKLESVLETLFSDPTLTVSMVASEMALSERQLHRKLTSVTSIGANEYLRQYRLYQALPLLLAGHNIAQTAEHCGFNSPSYFSACFKKQFGLTAKQYAKSHSSKTDNQEGNLTEL